jgi:hypothetical protein
MLEEIRIHCDQLVLMVVCNRRNWVDGKSNQSFYFDALVHQSDMMGKHGILQWALAVSLHYQTMYKFSECHGSAKINACHATSVWIIRDIEEEQKAERGEKLAYVIHGRDADRKEKFKQR